MRLRMEDKNFLNENLKKIINKYIIEKDFFDFDRPKKLMKEVWQEVSHQKSWTKFKHKLEEDIHRESNMMRYYKNTWQMRDIIINSL